MDIAAMSIHLNQAKVQQQASVSVLKMAMDTSEITEESIGKLLDSSQKALELAVHPHLGSNLDVKY